MSHHSLLLFYEHSLNGINTSVAVDEQLSVADEFGTWYLVTWYFFHIPCGRFDTFSPLRIKPVDAPIVTAEIAVSYICEIAVVAVVFRALPYQCVILGGFLYLIGKRPHLGSHGVFLRVVIDPPLFLNRLLEDRPFCQLPDPVLLPGRVIIDPGLLVPVVGIAEIPHRSEFPFVGYAQAVAVLIEESTAVITLAVLHDLLHQVEFRGFRHVQSLFQMGRHVI